MRLSLPFLLFAVARAFGPAQRAHHNRLRRDLADSTSIAAMSTLALSSPPSLLPSVPLSVSVPLSSSSPPSSSVPPQSTLASSSFAPSPTPTPSAASSQPSAVALPSSTPSSSTAPPSAATSTSSAPVAVAQSQPASSSTSITLLDGASTPTQRSSSSVYVLASTFSTSATPSSTPTQPSSSGFFSNTGAVAGTFTVVGLFSIAGVIAVALLIARRRRSPTNDEDTEFLDKSPDLSAHPPITQVTSLDDGSASDHAHYGAPPMVLATPPAAYYPDHAYLLHPQAFSQEAYQHDHPSHHVASTQDYPPQRIYFPEDYDIAYPPVSRVGANMPNPHEFTDVELDSAPVPPTISALPSALRPSVNSIPSAPKQWAGTRFSVDSFYAGLATDTPPSPGRAV